MEFKDVFKELRKDFGYTATKIAAVVGYSKNIIYEWEKGRTQPNIETLNKLARLFDVTVDYLTGNSDELGQTVANVELTEAERNLLFYFRNTTVAGQRAISDSAKSIYEALKSAHGIAPAN